jgi:hypothetical protein
MICIRWDYRPVGAMAFLATQISDLYKLHAGRERCEIPVMFVFGG